MRSPHIMVIGSHADDIEFNTGGTLLKYRERGYGVDYVMATNNMSGQLHAVQPDQSVKREECLPEDMERIRKREAAAAAAVLGTVPIHLNYPQRHYTAPDLKGKIVIGYGTPPLPRGCRQTLPNIMTAHEFPDETKRVAELILDRNPEAVITHSPVTASPEHYGTALLVIKAFAEAGKKGYAGPLLFFNEICRSSLFLHTFLIWDSFTDITGFREQQFELIRCHLSAVPFPERMDYLDFTTVCGIREAELYTWFRIKEQAHFPVLGDFTAELNHNMRNRNASGAPGAYRLR